MNEMAPNLYEYFGLNPADGSDVLALALSERMGQLELAGAGPSSQQYQQVQTAYGVLSSVTNRAVYDETVKSRQLAWHELGHLANFGRLPVYGQTDNPYQSIPATPPPATEVPSAAEPQQQQASGYQTYQEYSQRQPQQQPQQPQQQPTFGYGDPAAQNVNPYATPPASEQPQPQQPTYQQPTYQYPPQQSAAPQANYPQSSSDYGAVNVGFEAERPTAGLRFGMAVIDFLIFSVIGFVPALMMQDSWLLSNLSSMLIGVIYYIGFEVGVGSTPGKMIFGYNVRDVDSKEKLSLEQSVKRNWWRILSLLPVLGGLASLIAGIVLFTTITVPNQLRGAQDRLANAEVAKG